MLHLDTAANRRIGIGLVTLADLIAGFVAVLLVMRPGSRQPGAIAHGFDQGRAPTPARELPGP